MRLMIKPEATEVTTIATFLDPIVDAPISILSENEKELRKLRMR